MEELSGKQPVSHKKIILVILTIGLTLLVTGGIIWYTLYASKSVDEGVAPRDSDFDLLSDADEILLGTDPAKNDTDGDGLSDFLEVQLKTNPKNAYSVSGGTLDSVTMMKKQLEQEQIDREARLKKLKQQN